MVNRTGNGWEWSTTGTTGRTSRDIPIPILSPQEGSRYRWDENGQGQSGHGHGQEHEHMDCKEP